MARYAMTIDLSLCVGCAACAVACKMENEVPPGGFRLWIRERELGVFPDLVVEFRPEQCLHCQNPPCVPVCPTGASYQREDGLVLVDPKKCIACGACVAACLMRPATCIPRLRGQVHLLRPPPGQGAAPRLRGNLPHELPGLGDLDDPESPVVKALKEAGRVDVLRGELGTRPKLFYLNAPSKKGLTRESEVRHD